MKKVSSKDLFRFKFVGDPQISPKGNQIVFTVSEVNEKENSYIQRLYRYDGQTLRSFTSGPHDGSPRWSPNNNEIAFISKRSEEEGNDLMIIRTDGGEAKILAHFKNGVGGAKWLDNNTIVVLAIEKTEKEDSKDDVHEIEQIPIWFNGKGFIYNKRGQLFTVKRNGKSQQITHEKGQISVFAPSPDGKSVAFVETPDPEHNALISDIFVLKVGEEKPLKLTKSNMMIDNIAWSPDSKKIAFTASDLKHGTFTIPQIYTITMDKRMRKVCDVDLSKENSVNSDVRGSSPNPFYWVGEWIYFTMTDGPSAKVYRARNGKVEEIIGGKRNVDGFSVAENGNIAFVSMDFTSLDEVYLFKNGKEKKVSRFNTNVLKTMKLSKPEHFDVKTSDGRRLDAWIMKPVDFDARKKYPTILEVHGGPKTAYGYGFFLEFQLLASKGYVVLFSNPLGSDGYGEKFSNIYGMYGKRDYLDLMEVVDESIKRFKFIDSKNLGVTGGSYGGYMTNWIVTQTDRFKAAVTQRSISNWVSFFGTTDIGYFFVPDQLGGDPWSNFDGYVEMSPITHVKDVKTPLLIIHSMEDYRCWLSGGLQFFTALRYLGKEAKLALFPSENHELSRSGKPFHRIKRLDLILDWFEEHLKEEKRKI